MHFYELPPEEASLNQEIYLQADLTASLWEDGHRKGTFSSIGNIISGINTAVTERCDPGRWLRASPRAIYLLNGSETKNHPLFLCDLILPGPLLTVLVPGPGYKQKLSAPHYSKGNYG